MSTLTAFDSPTGGCAEVELVELQPHHVSETFEATAVGSFLMADNRGRIDSTTQSGFRDAVGFIKGSSGPALAGAWQETTIPVDGAPVTFRVAQFGPGFWTALGRVEGSLITVRGLGADLGDVYLVREPV
jgi:hypothetical protein